MEIKPTKENTFCYFPFYAMSMKLFDGKQLKGVTPCCKMSNNGTTVLDQDEINELTPLEIFEHEKFEKI